MAARGGVAREPGSKARRSRSRDLRGIPWGLLLALAAAAPLLGVGFWLKWRILLQPNPVEWYRYSAGQFAYSDLPALYLQEGLAHHLVPYLQTPVQYPVIIGAAQYLASFAPGIHEYFLVGGAILGLAGLGAVWAIYRMDRSARLLVFAATPPLLFYGALNWDLLAIFFTLISLLLFQKRRDGWSAFFITLGIWTKLFPALLVPWMVLQRTRERNWRRVGLIGAVTLAISLALNLPVYLASPSGWGYFLRFQALRPPDYGSIWAYLPAQLTRSADLVGFALVAACVLFMSLVGPRKGQPAGEFSLGALALLLLVARATSPQYNLWLMPFLALTQVPVWIVGVFVAVDAAYFWSSFQTLYIQWGGQSGVAALVEATFRWIVLARWLVLLAILGWVWIRLLKR